AADYSVGYNPGQFKEWGFTPVQIVRRDPLFEGLPEEVVVREAHAYHVVQVPDGFELLASTAECKVQAFKHRQRLVYGTQFHPEVNDDDHPHGRAILENFFRLAGLGGEPDAGRQGRQPNRCCRTGLDNRSRWSLEFAQENTILDVCSAEEHDNSTADRKRNRRPAPRPQDRPSRNGATVGRNQ
ncbi:MAG: gamma-glutamyl-gamma-aminobutyrate hydrolase family protein, partial [Planctomycetes bacterium]|nr:gamma-glutamyl-gamma-aminobutyrate hydrolase family protein [Planctomycetota bacterium]